MSTDRRRMRPTDDKLYRAVIVRQLDDDRTDVYYAGPYTKPAPAKAYVTQETRDPHPWRRTTATGYVEVGEVVWRRLDAEPGPTLEARLGEYRDVAPLADEDHTRIGPITEWVMRRG